MHRCFIEPQNWREGQVEPSREEAHHLLHVLRASDGDRVALFNGRGLEADAVVCIDADGNLDLVINEVRPAASRRVDITLIVAMPKGTRFDWAVEKATELGVAGIMPVISERTVSRPLGTKAVKKVERWQRVALAAAKQCGTKWLPTISPICSYSEMLRNLQAFDAVLIGSLVDGVKPLHEAIAELRSGSPHSIAVIIGPEGDLTPDEIRAALDTGAIPVSFGELTLRVETAAIYAASILAYEFLWQG